MRRGQPLVMFIMTLVALALASLPMSGPAFADWQYSNKINALEYKQKYGFWEVINLPQEFRLNAMHGALLPTGKVLLVAGTGNNQDNFNAYNDQGKLSVLKTAVLDPKTLKVKLVDTPSDLFCSGHAFMQSGNLLVAGGTTGYEKLEGVVTNPAGPMIIHNENPDDKPRTFKKGTKFISQSGKAYRTMQDVVVNPADKMDHGNGNVMIHHSSTKVFVEAEKADSSYITDKNEQFKIEGLKGQDRENIYGQGGPMTLEKQDFRGDNKAYEFDPIKEEYVPAGTMNESRWYPSLPVLTDGSVLAVSGLDNTGIITDTTEWYNSASKTWSWGPTRLFPTYPALFRTQDPNTLFFSGSSAGYGPEDKGREPGFWNVKDNSFKPVKGLRDPNIVETSGSVMLPPKKGSNDGSQNQKIMVAGGGGVGESELVTARTDIIDLALQDPMYLPGPDLPSPLRYLNLTVTPWDEVFATGGSRDYRAKGNSYSNAAFSIDPSSNTISELADEPIGRSYHSGSILLPDGRILVFGNDPLYSDKDNTAPGIYEQRLEIFTPPQFYTAERPKLQSIDNLIEVKRGQQIKTNLLNKSDTRTARLIPPSSTTHVTNIEQRSVSAILSRTGNELTINIPTGENVLPNGWYMLFIVDKNGLSSEAKMIKIVN